jgi:hypothetical protein
MTNRALGAIVVIALGFLAASPVSAQQIQFIAVDGTVNPPAILQSSLPAGQRPTVQRLGLGLYRFTFQTNVVFFNAHAQRGGVGGDASLMLLASTFHSNNGRIVDVHTFVLTPGATTSTAPRADARLSVVFTR